MHIFTIIFIKACFLSTEGQNPSLYLMLFNAVKDGNLKEVDEIGQDSKEKKRADLMALWESNYDDEDEEGDE